MAKIDRLLEIVRSDDPEEIEAGRDEVTPEDLGPLAEAYWSLENWGQKCNLVNLVQDHIDPRTREIMRDLLRAPDEASGDYVEITKAIALCHLEGDFGRFMVYYNDRQLLAQTVEHGLAERRPEAAKAPKLDKKWWQFWKK